MLPVHGSTLWICAVESGESRVELLAPPYSFAAYRAPTSVEDRPSREGAFEIRYRRT